MLFRQLFDSESSTYTYLIADDETKEAVLIDPVIDQAERDSQLLHELGLKLIYTFDTHAHADHITAAGVLKRKLGSQSVVGERSGAACPDVFAKEGDVLRVGSIRFDVIETPGHTNGCVTYVTSDKEHAFTGDALLIRGCGRTDFQQGDSHALFRSVHEKIFSLPDHTKIWPAHDYHGFTMSTVEEEKRFNKRLRLDLSEQDFVEIMNNLKLAQPKKIKESVPANLMCGTVDPKSMSGEPVAERGWAPIERTLAGVPEVSLDWVREHGADVHLVDVREPNEWNSNLKKLSNADAVPLASITVSASDWDLELPLITICRSGGRSGKAARQLEQMGFKRVASMRGGMMAWHEAQKAP